MGTKDRGNINWALKSMADEEEKTRHQSIVSRDIIRFIYFHLPYYLQLTGNYSKIPFPLITISTSWKLCFYSQR